MKKTTSTPEHYRQGDLLFIRTAQPKTHGKRIKNGVLALGEVTGHSHRIADLTAAEAYEIGGGVFLRVSEKGVSIVHEEHAPVTLGSGAWEMRRQREYDPERKPRTVRD